MIHASVHDDRRCDLGEGVFWHPERKQLFWVDILGRRILSRDGDAALSWDFPEPVSAMGWIDRDTLFVATASGFHRFDIATGATDRLADLEADDPGTRSNDGRADPQGGFWLGTMGCEAEEGRGTIYRYHRGTVRALFRSISIPNAICFAPGGETAYFADTAQSAVWAQRLDRAGWPSGPSELFLDLSAAGLAPDGAVCDADGNLWVAQWGAWRVACYGPDGRFRQAIGIGAAHASCPGFGGADLKTLYVTSARAGLPDPLPDHHVLAGTTWAATMDVAGIPEPRVVP